MHRTIAVDPGGSSPSDRPTNLLLPLTTLIGRLSEVELIQDYLSTSERRLLTLVGTGGIGKTRLALDVAFRARDAYADGVWLVELATINDPALVALTITQTLQIPVAAGYTIEQQLRQALCDKQMLLVLDNFEQIVEAAPLVGELVRHAPQLTVLVTSRSPLHLRGEQVIEVPPLRLPPMTEEAAGVGRIGQYEAVQCFVAQAQAVRADFVLNASNVRAVAELCVQLDGLPLALELAAARVSLLSPQVMLDRLSSSGALRLKLLVGGARDLPARQRTMRATIEWSFSLLDPDEQRLFARLAVFAGGCTIEAVEAVCGTQDFATLDTLQSLCDKSLIRRLSPRSTAQVSQEPRIAMLETIREYALEQLEACGETDAVRERHATYFLGLAETAEVELSRSAQHMWLERLEQEHDNLRAVLDWGLAHHTPLTLEIALRLTTALTAFWKIRGYPGEGRGWWERLLAVDGMPAALRARALAGAGTMAWMLSGFARATDLHGQALALSRMLGDKHGIATALNHLAAQAMEQGQHQQALQSLQESISLRRELDDVPGMIETLNNLGVVAEREREYTQAAIHYQEGLALSQASGNQWTMALLLTNLGEVAQYQGDYGRAITLYDEGFAVASALESRPLCAALLHKLGNLATIQGMPWQAVDRLKQGLELWRQLGNTVGIITCLEGLAAALAAGPRHSSERDQGAVVLWSVAEAQREAIHSHLPLADLLLYTPFLQAARTYLGETTYAIASQKGRTMPLDQAVAYAARLVLESPQDAPGADLAPTSAGSLEGLSEREREVLRLVAMGLPDKAVAERLVISPRTVHAHLASIYSKLGIKSRHAATLIALENRLVAPD